MRSKRKLCVIPAIFLILSATAHGGGDPFEALQAQIDALSAQVLALQADAPNPSVVGRLYCRTRSDTITIPDGTLVRAVTRQVWTFDPPMAAGTLSMDPISNVRTTQESTGPNTRSGTIGGTQSTANYTQIGNLLAITFVSGNVVNFHVSADGSLAVGWRIAGSGPIQSGPANIQNENLLVEIGSLAECAPDMVTDYP
jgi:hypothetical protein